ncbi:MAG TPA: amidase [Geminicoccaceae bacterium]|nr:amidase [Geminicoccaceae bacterium]
MIEAKNELVTFTAVQAAQLIRDHKLSALELTQACLEQIEAAEPEVQAFAFLDPEHAQAQARALDDQRGHGRPLGPLHGVPVGVKDIIDTEDMPTENGTVLHAGRRPRADAAVVSRLRAAGAVILGKTVTTELAVYAPNKTRNPHDPEQTPGGSSSGSAAAVAARMLPLALGTQTNGSVIRPAAYCGVYGFKPGHGLISRAGILRQSPPLDTVGVMANSLPDLALLAEVLMGYDPADPALRPSARPRLLEVAMEPPPVVPDLGFVRTPVWDQAEDETRAAFEELVAALGERVAAADLPPAFDHAVSLHGTIMEADLARSFAKEYERGRDRLSARLCQMIERGQRCVAVDYNRALDAIPSLVAALEPLFERYDALLTPATTGPAPHGLGSTGSPVFCTIWTLCGMPAVSLPLLQAGNGLPLGVQLVGRKGDDARLLRTARWLIETLRAEV